jgi:integrase
MEAIVVSVHPDRGRVYRRCACRDVTGKQIGARCAQLIRDSRHGRWAFAVDMPSLTGRRSTMRRCGFVTKSDAQSVVHRVLACERAGVEYNDRQTVADYLGAWLRVKSVTLKPTTLARYTDYVTKDLIPAMGAIRLEHLHHRHIAQFVRDQMVAGRGLITLRRCVATLSSALTDAVRQHRLVHNPARYTVMARPPSVERVCWTPKEAVTFLRHCAEVADPLADLYEVIIGTGMRRGEALALHWSDVHVADRVLFVRYTLSNVDNARPVLSPPKTRSSYVWIALSDRVVAVLTRQRERGQRLMSGPGYEDQGLDVVDVFSATDHFADIAAHSPEMLDDDQFSWLTRATFSQESERRNTGVPIPIAVTLPDWLIEKLTELLVEDEETDKL